MSGNIVSLQKNKGIHAAPVQTPVISQAALAEAALPFGRSVLEPTAHSDRMRLVIKKK
jgi:hypothetical protein